ncbi:MAG: preprotein translocase subunit SecE [Candidatus Magasanikbacteria bacterium]|jgi:preprotein translocase subunit SecE|nr:preprotein translocase subunit SecE [Candidatus Magasanikbacteria bacterium]MBT4220668.1 preprotein translocase subunit SecE [Candidatus Magasanikbacteria bacterium]MBT4350384.1 preprotein translocase subunit SecE [Candidatus Magasanikbacteria bacterium]MBT4541834.1 preprotein translocase subunit SecE [Candidatus Magasanikbacteria bacterium]MBT6252756.1 preprotein translocase subunit SecE [Candidatus Magasanikbacteria bacterium]
MTFFAKTKDYFQGAASELKKVVWPTKKQTIDYSIIVVALSLGMAVFFGVLDWIFSNLLGLLI